MDDHKEPRAELSSAVLRRLVLARFLYNQALENAVLRREVTEFAAINTLQDAIEVFFLAATDYLNVDLGKKTEFEQYIDKVNDRLGEKELPFRRRLIEINKVRVLSKHQGIPPNPSELMGYLQAAREFFDQAAALIFGRPFWAVSLVDLLPETDEAKGLLLLAERQFHGGDYSECLITCRKVMFIKYECRGSIEGYRDGRFSEPIFASWLAADYACSREFIANHVETPFDFVHLDHSRLESELMKDGIDPEVYWNISRLTPALYRSGKEGADWLVKHEPQKLAAEGIEDRASYVLDNTIDIALRLSARKKVLRRPTSSTFPLKLMSPCVTIYRKADALSEVLGTVPGGVDVYGLYGTPSFDRTGYFWRILFEMDGRWTEGFVSGLDVSRQ